MHHTRRRTLLAITGAHRGPARRDDPAGGNTGAGASNGGGTGGTTPPPADEPATGETTDWKAEADKWKALSRQNESQAKANADAAKQWAKVTGLFEGEKPDADQLAAKLTDAQRQAQTWQDSAGAAQVENIVLRTAYRLGANADRILDSRTMCDEIDDLEPENAADFAKQVEAKIKGWIEKDPTLKAATAGGGPARIGAEHTGGGNPGRQRVQGLHAAVEAAYRQQ